MPQIQREGRISFGDASLSIWEEGIRAARDAGGHKGEEEWCRAFKREVFARVVQTMNRLGWELVIPQEKIDHYGRDFALKHRYCVKGDLKADLSISGRCIELNFFQNVNAPDRPDHEGRYQFDKEKHMPYLLRLEMERTRRRVRDYLCNVLEGYTFEPNRRLKVGPGHHTAMEACLEDRKHSGHYRDELGRAQYSNDAQKSADGGVIEDGMRVYGIDFRGRVITGTALYCLNGNWTIVTGRYGSTHNVWHNQVYLKSPGNLRRKGSEKKRRERLEAQLNIAIGAMNFERAGVLRDIIYPPGEPIFCLWHREHEAYHCAGFSGYTKDQMQAGKFTRAELKGWADDRNAIVPFGKRP